VTAAAGPGVAAGALGLSRWAGLRPDREAVVIDGGRFTFAQLYAAADRASQLLRDMGVRAGDRVGIAMRNRFEYCQANAAVWLAGAVVVPVAYRAKADELDYLVDDAGMSVVVVEDDGYRPQGSVQVLTWTEFAALSDGYQAAPPPPEGPRVVQRLLPYTSGTTGRPKALRRPGSPDGFTAQDSDQLFRPFPVATNEGVHLCVAPL
jgi:acyl-CoA synthetase (AMP-forming)/AMP-acid ligase II